MQFSPCSNYIVSVSGDNTVWVWDSITETSFDKILYHDSWVMIVQWRSDAKGFLTGDYNGSICYWDLEELKTTWLKKREMRKFDQKQNPTLLFKGHKGFITSLKWRPYHIDGESDFFVSASKDMTLRIWSLKT